MVDTAAIEELRTAQSQLSKLVQRQLEALFAQIDLSDPVAARNLLLELIPELVGRYGASAETIARDWYAEHRAEVGLTGRYRVEAPPSSITPERVQNKVRYLAGDLWTADPGAMLGDLSLAVNKYVRQPGRDVIAYNAKREGARWARVPTGAKTCSFCLVMASRDAVFVSKRAAGDQGRGVGDRFHGKCDCEVVMIGRHDDYPPGYLPDDFYQKYEVASDRAAKDPEVQQFLDGLDPNDANARLKGVVFAMRREFPGLVTDGVH